MMHVFPPRFPSSTLLRLSAAVLAAACLFGPTASAQIQSPASPAPDRSDSSNSIPDQKLDAAATALQKVVDLKRDYQQRIDAAASDADKQGIADEAKGALAKAVTDQGLSLEEYTAIIVIAQRDPQVREEILRRLPPDK